MSLKKNVIANYLGQGWAALMGLAFIPVYIKYLGIEAYGLIGIFALLQAWLALLEMGMMPALSREMARFTGTTHSVTSIRNVLRSIEIIALGIAVLIVIGVWATSEWLASDWLKADRLPVNTVAHAFSIMGIITATRLIENIYRSSLVGLQKQVTLNVITSIMATLKGLGAVGILIWVSPSIEAFFIWQGLLTIVSASLFAYFVYSTLPKTNSKGKFSILAIREIRGFAGGMMGITFLALLLTQIDKIILSKILTLEAFGYYSFAAIMAGALHKLINPITQAFYPRLSELVARSHEQQLILDFHKSAQLVTVIMGSAAITLMFFAEPILRLWTQDPDLAQRSATLVALLALGNLLNGLMWVPYQTQLAHGWTSLTIKINLISVAIIIPMILWAVPTYGAVGAAWVWVLLNAGYVLIGNHFMYRKILRGQKWHWYFQDVLFPLAVAVVVASLFYLVAPAEMTIVFELMWILIASISILVASTLTVHELRIRVLKFAAPKSWLKNKS